MSSSVPPRQDALEALALRSLSIYMRRAGACSEDEELIARDAFLSGYRAGGRQVMRTCSELAALGPLLRQLLAFLEDGDQADPPFQPDAFDVFAGKTVDRWLP